MLGMLDSSLDWKAPAPGGAVGGGIGGEGGDAPPGSVIESEVTPTSREQALTNLD